MLGVLSWTTPEGRVRSHAPDYFARRADGSAVVVDCRPAERCPSRDLAAFEATRRACELLGWEYGRRRGGGKPIVVLPVLFHLLWCQDLVTDLLVPLHPCASVTTAATGLVAV